MGQEIIDLCGRICPYPVVEIVREVGRLRSGETLRCVVDDPLALKSVPEELEDFPDMTITITKLGKVWEITVERE
ncbi:MAG: sulfurtransferase TusA family protein [Phycisphaerae bacterium]|nr:sulfurtransferase TusA family protein [Phycisphaerae bacterium]